MGEMGAVWGHVGSFERFWKFWEMLQVLEMIEVFGYYGSLGGTVEDLGTMEGVPAPLSPPPALPPPPGLSRCSASQVRGARGSAGSGAGAGAERVSPAIKRRRGAGARLSGCGAGERRCRYQRSGRSGGAGAPLCVSTTCSSQAPSPFPRCPRLAAMPNFSGNWKMKSSENFEELLKALGECEPLDG